MDVLDLHRVRAIDPAYDGTYAPPRYIEPGTLVEVEVESRETELALLAAYEYGLPALSTEGREQVQRFISDAVLRLKGDL